MEINGSLRTEDGKMIVFEARSIERDRIEIVAKVRGERFESVTNNPSPWPAIERAVAQALDSHSATKVPAAKFDMNRPLVKKVVAKSKRKIKPGDLPGSNKLDLDAIQERIREELTK